MVKLLRGTQCNALFQIFQITMKRSFYKASGCLKLTGPLKESGEKLFGSIPEKEMLNLIGYLEPPLAPPVAPNRQLSGAIYFQKVN